MIIKAGLHLPSQWTYQLAPYILKFYSTLFSAPTPSWHPISWRHLQFSNPLGTAGGVDKNAKHIQDWQSLGAGFCEIGTVTPEAQEANPSPILDRNLKYQSLWNHMGFPNQGLNFVKQQLASLSSTRRIPLLINIGKNRNTKTEEAVKDYKKCLEELHPFADIFVINISSPNTKDLRTIFNQTRLPSFLKTLKETSSQWEKQVPLILKLSPDETEEEFFRIIDQSLEAGIDGWCLSNSTSARSVSNIFPAHGGVSGQLLKKKSCSLLKKLKNHLDKNQIQDRLIISCGGVLTAQEVLHRLELGAHLVQAYSALVFKGPRFFQSVFKHVSQTKS